MTDDVFYQNLGKLIKQKRQQCGFTIEHTLYLINRLYNIKSSKGSFSTIESGKRKMTLKYFLALMMVLKIDLKDVLKNL